MTSMVRQPQTQGRDDRQLALEILATIQAWSYRDVRLPAWLEFERIQTGLEKLGASTCKFIAPDGRVLVLLPDPTLAVLTQGGAVAADGRPTRLCYWADAFRAGDETGWLRIPQVGAELLGPSSVDAEAEILAVAMDAVRVGGRPQSRVLVNDVQLTESICSLLGSEAGVTARAALGRGDFVTLQRLTERRPEVFDALRYSGSAAGLRTLLSRVQDGQAVEAALYRVERLERIARLVEATGYEADVLVDVSLVREIGYYDGFVFQILEPGTGRFLAGGGRYDGLLSAVGMEGGGSGFACDLQALTTFQSVTPLPDYVIRRRADAPVERVWQEAARLRQQGYMVYVLLEGETVIPEARHGVVTVTPTGVETVQGGRDSAS